MLFWLVVLGLKALGPTIIQTSRTPCPGTESYPASSPDPVHPFWGLFWLAASSRRSRRSFLCLCLSSFLVTPTLAKYVTGTCSRVYMAALLENKCVVKLVRGDGVCPLPAEV